MARPHCLQSAMKLYHLKQVPSSNSHYCCVVMFVMPIWFQNHDIVLQDSIIISMNLNYIYVCNYSWQTSILTNVSKQKLSHTVALSWYLSNKPTRHCWISWASAARFERSCHSNPRVRTLVESNHCLENWHLLLPIQALYITRIEQELVGFVSGYYDWLRYLVRVLAVWSSNGAAL